MMKTSQYPKQYIYRQMVQAKLFIDRNYSNDIDLGNIADKAFFSKFHFIRLFKEIYGRTPHQYLISVRIERAMLLFQDGGYVSEVCTAVGFESLSTFSGLFKRRVGITPMVYLRQQQAYKLKMSETPLVFIPMCFAKKKGWTENSNFEEIND